MGPLPIEVVDQIGVRPAICDSLTASLRDLPNANIHSTLIKVQVLKAQDAEVRIQIGVRPAICDSLRTAYDYALSTDNSPGLEPARRSRKLNRPQQCSE